MKGQRPFSQEEANSPVDVAHEVRRYILAIPNSCGVGRPCPRFLGSLDLN